MCAGGLMTACFAPDASCGKAKEVEVIVLLSSLPEIGMFAPPRSKEAFPPRRVFSQGATEKAMHVINLLFAVDCR